MARSRRKVFIDANNHDRWVVSYADFITLLFAFFVVMYSISSVNEGKYRSLTESLGTAFSNNYKQVNKFTPSKMEPVLINRPALPLDIPFESTKIELNANASSYEEETERAAHWLSDATPAGLHLSAAPEQLAPPPSEAPTKSQPDSPVDLQPAPAKPEPASAETHPELGQETLKEPLAPASELLKKDDQSRPETEERRELSAEILKEREKLNQASNQLEQALGSFIDEHLVAVKRNDYWIELEMNSELLFLSGEAALSKKAPPVLKKIVEVINALPHAINVEGHTDNIPINNLKYPSNWELSSARATSVVQELVKEGVNPTRLSAVGYGEFHPIGDNGTLEGRFQNRRVTLVLMSEAFARYGANDEERAKLLNLKSSMESGRPALSQP